MIKKIRGRAERVCIDLLHLLLLKSRPSLKIRQRQSFAIWASSGWGSSLTATARRRAFNQHDAAPQISGLTAVENDDRIPLGVSRYILYRVFLTTARPFPPPLFFFGTFCSGVCSLLFRNVDRLLEYSDQ